MSVQNVAKNRIVLLWILVAAFCWIYPYLIHRGNNFKIFIGVYNHLVSSSDLYIEYPKEYFDTNHYGPLFGILIAPFAILPYFLGGLLWNIFNSVMLLFAINKLPVETSRKNTIALLSLTVFAQSQYDMQSNAFIASIIILSFIFTIEGKERAATFLIVLGTLIKLYPIVGLAFFLFSDNKRSFTIWLLIWGGVLALLPALFSSFEFILSSYSGWFHSLREKNQLNIDSSSQNYSIMGLFMRIFPGYRINSLLSLSFGIVILGMNLLAFLKSNSEQVPNLVSMKFKLYILSSVLLTVVLFSTGSESPTYIIAAVGCFIWLAFQEKPFDGFNLFLTVFLIVILGAAPTDLFPKKVRDLLLTDLVIMTWPCILIWIKISWELVTDPWVSKRNQSKEVLHVV